METAKMPKLMNGLRKCGIYTRWILFSLKKEILSSAGKWMELENIILSEVKSHMFSLICVI
jgi:hypothetical protein